MFKTSDLSIAAYLLMKDIKLSNAYRGNSGQFIFEFLDPESLCKKYSIEYTNSDIAKYDNHVRNLKKILYSK